jgi:hypothetical protein
VGGSLGLGFDRLLQSELGFSEAEVDILRAEFHSRRGGGGGGVSRSGRECVALRRLPHENDIEEEEKWLEQNRVIRRGRGEGGEGCGGGGGGEGGGEEKKEEQEQELVEKGRGGRGGRGGGREGGREGGEEEGGREWEEGARLWLNTDGANEEQRLALRASTGVNNALFSDAHTLSGAHTRSLLTSTSHLSHAASDTGGSCGACDV